MLAYMAPVCQKTSEVLSQSTPPYSAALPAEHFQALGLFGHRSNFVELCTHQPSLAARPRTYLLQTGSYDVSIHPRHLSVLSTVMFLMRFRHDIQMTAVVFYLTSSGRSTRSFLYVQSAGGHFRFLVPPSGTICLSASHLCRHSRFSDDSRPFCFPVPAKILS